MQVEQIREKLRSRELKITPQRVSILEAIYFLKNHPTAQQIIDKVHENNPNIAAGTIYKTLETLVETGVISKVSTTDEVARYDCRMDNHHHIYNNENNHIEDYLNKELDELLESFFDKNKIPNYDIDAIQVQIKGRYTKKRKNI